MKLKIFIFVFIFTFLFWGAQSASAAGCPTGSVPGQPSNHQYTGDDCSGLAAAQTNDYLRCIGRTGCRYWVFYCDNQTGGDCMAKYDESNCSTAPLLCNKPDTGATTEVSKIFGVIDPPQAIHNFGFGAKAISQFLSNGVTLIYSIAAIVLIVMILMGAFGWMTSGGDKEKLAAAQKRIIHAIIGIILFGVAFAIIQVLGTFTGFQFFVGQK